MTDFQLNDEVIAIQGIGWMGVGRVKTLHYAFGGITEVEVEWPAGYDGNLQAEIATILMGPREIELYVPPPVGQGVDALERWLSA